MRNHSLGYPDSSDFERMLSKYIDHEQMVEYFTSFYEDVLHELYIAEHKLKQIEQITKDEE